MIDLDTLINQKLKLPSLPAVVVRLNQLLGARAPSLREAGRLIGEDPALAARVLRLANSPVFAIGRSVTSLQEAVALLGVRELRSLVTAASALSLFADQERLAADMEQFWSHSVYSALLARALAVHAGEEGDTFFVIGLLHRLGTLVLLHHQPEAQTEAIGLANQEGLTLAEAERRVLGFSHAEVGGELMRTWELPEIMAVSIAGYADPAPAGSWQRPIGLTRLAALIADSLEGAALAIDRVAPPGEDDWAAAGVSADFLPELISAVQADFALARQALVGAPHR